MLVLIYLFMKSILGLLFFYLLKVFNRFSNPSHIQYSPSAYTRLNLTYQPGNVNPLIMLTLIIKIRLLFLGHLPYIFGLNNKITMLIHHAAC